MHQNYGTIFLAFKIKAPALDQAPAQILIAGKQTFDNPRHPLDPPPTGRSISFSYPLRLMPKPCQGVL